MLPKELPDIIFEAFVVEPCNPSNSADCHENGKAEEDAQADLSGTAK